jgi:hypothetical protein
MRARLPLLLIALSATGQNWSAETWHRPTPMPDRVILNVAADPAHEIGLTWRTDTSVRKAAAEIAAAGDGPDFPQKAQTVGASTTAFKSDLGEAHYHSLKFTGLKPGTLYAYRAGGGSQWSEWHQFRTAGDQPAPLTFIYVGDSQTNLFSMWSRLIRMGYAHAPQAHFILHAGDLVNTSDNDAQWGEWHKAASWINAVIPSLPSAGNHEYGKGPQGRALTAHWRTQFTLPENGVPGVEESNYSIDIQGVRVVSLNSNEKQKEQGEWLDKLLAANPRKWTVITFHHPVFSAARGRDNKELRELWQPLFDKYAVDLVMTGHDHTYARSNLTSGLNTRSSKAGTVYVVSVSGPKMYQLDREEWMVRAAQDTQLFQVVRIDGDRLVYESRTARGALYDSFELSKQAGKPNKLVNRIPAGPERVRRGG